jgi:hypothetical protein
MFTLIILLLINWFKTNKIGYIIAAIFFFGLSLSNHLITILMFPALLYAILIKEHKKSPKLRKISIKLVLILILVFLLGLSPYLYLPIRSAQDPSLDWGNPENAQNFMRHVTGREFGFKMFNFRLSQLGTQLENLFIKQFFIVFGLIALFGLFVLYKKNLKIWTFLMLLIFFFILFNLTYDINDIIYYYIPVYIIFSIFIAYGVLGIKHKIPKLLLYLPLFGLVIFMAMINYGVVKKNNQYFAYEYARNIYESIGEDAILFTKGDINIFPLLYYSNFENPPYNITVVDTILLSKPWYIEQLSQKGILKDTKDIPFYYESEEEADHIIRTLVNETIYGNSIPAYFTIFFSSEHELGIPEFSHQNHVYKLGSDKDTDLILDYEYLFDPKVRKTHQTKRILSDMFNYVGVYYLNKGEQEKAFREFQQSVLIKPNSFIQIVNTNIVKHI